MSRSVVKGNKLIFCIIEIYDLQAMVNILFSNFNGKTLLNQTIFCKEPNFFLILLKQLG